MSDEILIVQTTLVLQGCPAFGCAGGDHEEIPEICIAWWMDEGWDLMQWEGRADNMNSAMIKQKCAEYVGDLTGGYGVQEQEKNQKEVNMDDVSHIKMILILNLKSNIK